MSDDQRPLLGIWCAITVFLSAFLLFQVQPVISKTILPWFGGSPSVWTACLLFFQSLLLLGYVYAHLLVQRVSQRWAAVIHLTLLLVAIALLPITPDGDWKPVDAGRPTLRILLLLTAHVGLPYFLLAAISGFLFASWRVSHGVVGEFIAVNEDFFDDTIEAHEARARKARRWSMLSGAVVALYAMVVVPHLGFWTTFTAGATAALTSFLVWRKLLGDSAHVAVQEQIGNELMAMDLAADQYRDQHL